MDEGNVKKSAESKQFHQSCIVPSSTKHQVQGNDAVTETDGVNEQFLEIHLSL